MSRRINTVKWLKVPGLIVKPQPKKLRFVTSLFKLVNVTKMGICASVLSTAAVLKFPALMRCYKVYHSPSVKLAAKGSSNRFTAQLN
jgi:hypothetical protein